MIHAKCFHSLPESVSSVGSGAFSNCRSLRKIVLRDHITRLEDCTFERCPSLSVFNLHPDDPEIIRDYHSIRYLEESIQTGLRILQTGDTSLPLDHKNGTVIEKLKAFFERFWNIG